jgi:serpin B
MRTSLILLLAVAALAVGAACGGSERAAAILRSDAPREPVPPGSPGPGDAVDAFAADLYAVLARDEGNLVFSPYSAAVALAMTRAGAVGETARQMDAVLHAELVDDLGAAFNAVEQALAERPGKYPQGDQTVELELATANQPWGQVGYEFDQAFLDRLAAHYGAGMQVVDYVEEREAARRAINEWVGDRTRDRIPELVPAGVLNELTRLVLTNAIYLKAPWLHPFAEGASEAAPFHRLDGSEVTAELMSVGARLRYGRGSDYEAVELPYVGGELAMTVIAPDEGEFESFEAGLDAARVGDVLDGLGDAQVRLRLPRFEFRTQAALKPALSELGMPIAFSEQADFSAMSPSGADLLIQEVLHEAFISVDEEGTEAAAATAVLAGVTSAPQLSVDLTVDRAFLFLIRDRESGTTLFMGRVLDPGG